MGFGVLAGGKAACEYPKISLFPPPWGQGVGNPGLSYFVKALFHGYDQFISAIWLPLPVANPVRHIPEVFKLPGNSP
jgi:hypothetical protein